MFEILGPVQEIVANLGVSMNDAQIVQVSHWDLSMLLIIIINHKAIIIKGYFNFIQLMAADLLMNLAENGNLVGDMKIHQDPEVSKRDLEDLNESVVDNEEAIRYFFQDIQDSLETSFALHQAKLIIAAESISWHCKVLSNI